MYKSEHLTIPLNMTIFICLLGIVYNYNNTSNTGLIALISMSQKMAMITIVSSLYNNTLHQAVRENLTKATSKLCKITTFTFAELKTKKDVACITHNCLIFARLLVL